MGQAIQDVKDQHQVVVDEHKALVDRLNPKFTGLESHLKNKFDDLDTNLRTSAVRQTMTEQRGIEIVIHAQTQIAGSASSQRIQYQRSTRVPLVEKEEEV